MNTKDIAESAALVFTTLGGEEPVGYALGRNEEPTAFTITRAWKVGQWRGGWYHDSTHHTWEGVKARAAFLRANGWETVDAIPFFCIVDGAAVHEVRTGPLVGRGEWAPERASVIRVDE